MRLAIGSSVSPAAVRVMLPRTRLNSGVPNSASRVRICLLNDDWAMWSDSAARVKCRVRATATKYSSRRRDTSIAYGYRNELHNVFDDWLVLPHRVRTQSRGAMGILTEGMKRLVDS